MADDTAALPGSNAQELRAGAIPFGLAALVFTTVFAGITWWVVSAPDQITAFDEAVATAVHERALANPWLVDVSLALEVLGGVPVSIAVVAVVVLALLFKGASRHPNRPQRYALVFLVICSAGGALLDTIIKALVDRTRPPWNGLWSLEQTPSYPSGHSQAGITVWVALGLLALVLLSGRAKWFVGLPLLFLGPLIGVSRSVLGVHWPTDVLGGWTLGAAWLSACAAAVLLWAARTAAAPSAEEGPGNPAPLSAGG